MNKNAHTDGAERTEKFYIPAATLPPNLGRIEAVVENLFDFHGVVLIPDRYNK